MTSTRALPVPHLELPTSEDIMEFSSELDRRPGIDEDIDIDFDFANEQLQDQDNDYIIEDARSEAGTGAQDLSAETGNDDVMLDEEGSPAEMHDDTLVQDEDVDDAGDFTQNDSNRRSAPLHKDADQYNDEVLDHSQQMDLPSDRLYSAPADDLEENIPEVSDNQILEAWQEETLGTLDVDANAKALEQPFPDLDPAVPVDSLLEHLRHEPDRSKTLASARNSATGSVASNTEPKLESHPEAALNNRGSPYVDFIAHTPELADAVKSVHPVVVIYQGSEISLFPPSAQNDSATFFLHDESLASNSISDLLVACKGVLADSISEEDELELRIEELGLCISEDSKSASSTTLYQILNVYLRLLHQDGISDADPLYMILNIKTSFPKRFSALRDAANKGKGISQLPYWEVSSDDDAATAADADSAYGILTEEPEKPDKTSDKLDLGTVDESSAQDKLRATDNGVSASQDNPTASVPSPNPADSQTFKAGRPTSTSGRGTSVIENSMPDTTVAPRIDTEAQDRGSPPGNGSDTRGSQDDVISPVLDRADDEEGDLIDYEDGDEPAIQDSTGSSTLAGDDAAEAANADYALDSENDPVTTSNAIERTENISDNITTEIGETHHFADEGLRARDNDPSFQIDEFQHADYDDKDSERYGRVDGDQLGSDNSNAKQSEYLPQSDFKQVLDDSAGLGSNAHYQDDAEDTADISNTGDPRDEGPIEEAEQESHDARELLYEGEPNAEEVETTSQPQQALFDGHDETLNGHETTREYLGETADDFLSRSRVRIAIPEDQLDPYSVAFASTADTDEISYEEDEIFDVVSDQEGEDNLDSKPPSPAKPTSTKRSRGEDEETGVPDDGSQDAKRARSG